MKKIDIVIRGIILFLMVQIFVLQVLMSCRVVTLVVSFSLIAETVQMFINNLILFVVLLVYSFAIFLYRDKVFYIELYEKSVKFSYIVSIAIIILSLFFLTTYC